MHTRKSRFLPCPGVPSFHGELASVPCGKHCRVFTQEGSRRTMSSWWTLAGLLILGKNSEERCNAWVSLLYFLTWCGIFFPKVAKTLLNTDEWEILKKTQKTPGPKPPKLEVSELSSPSQKNCENYSSLLKRNSHWNANFDFDYLSRPALKFFRQK